MNTIIISGHTANNFGSNNYSYDMEAIVFNHKDITVREVEKLPNVFLHPTVEPNSLEIFALLGTKEQFDKFYASAVATHCSKKAIDKFGMPDYSDRDAWNELNSYRKDLESEFVPWYTYYAEPV